MRVPLITVRDGASFGKRRWAVYALLAWIVLGQFAGIVHRESHEASPTASACVLCIAANHLAAPIVEHLLVLAPLTPAFEPPALAHAHSAPNPHRYRSRAPPLRN